MAAWLQGVINTGGGGGWQTLRCTWCSQIIMYQGKCLDQDCQLIVKVFGNHSMFSVREYKS